MEQNLNHLRMPDDVEAAREISDNPGLLIVSLVEHRQCRIPNTLKKAYAPINQAKCSIQELQPSFHAWLTRSQLFHGPNIPKIFLEIAMMTNDSFEIVYPARLLT